MSNLNAHEDFRREIRTKQSSDRSFGLVFAAVFAIVAFWPVLHHQPVRLWAVPMSLLCLLLALFRPAALHGPNVIWFGLGLALGRIVTPVVTGVLFFFVVTPIALLLRVQKKDPLRLRPDAGLGSFWLPRNPPGPAPDTMNRQF